MEEGYPLFDLVVNPTSVKIDNREVNVKLISTPGNVSKMRMIDLLLPPGIYRLEIKAPLTFGLKFKKQTVSSNFWVKDMLDRHMLERYLPSNLEFDQYKMSMDIKILNSDKKHRLYTNGNLSEFDYNHYAIDFPYYYNASSYY